MDLRLRVPPFHEEASPYSTLSQRNVTIPTLYGTGGELKVIADAVPDTISSSEGFKAFVTADLDVSRLSLIHRHLWLAGLPVAARPLHRQCLIGRQLVITEDPNLHMVWQDKTLFLKPLPECIMYWQAWKAVLCSSPQLYENANGMLLSYLWLVRYRSDLKIAHDTGLLPSELDWTQWNCFTKAIISHLDCENLQAISPRYFYGELQLDRLNSIYRFSSETRSVRSFLLGYYLNPSHQSLISRGLGFFTFTVIIYIVLVLTAMQVGFGTTQLQHNEAFSRAAYGFTVFSIVGPLIIIFLMTTAPMLYYLLVFVHALPRRRRRLKHRRLDAGMGTENVHH